MKITSRLHQFDISENGIGPCNFTLLQRIFQTNTKIEVLLSIADCKIDMLIHGSKHLVQRSPNGQELRSRGDKAPFSAPGEVVMVTSDFCECKVAAAYHALPLALKFVPFETR